MPRDGSMREEGKYFANMLDQQWTFESDAGQISFVVAPAEVPGEPAQQMHHSYQGGQPQDMIQTDVSVRDADRDTLELLFHPGGDNAPKEELFEALIVGPGAPEAADGAFLWLRDPLYLILPRWMLEILSFGILSPSKKKSKSGLSPGFCPNRVPEGSPAFNERMVLVYSVLKDTFENWPPGQPTKNIPFGSMLVYKPVSEANASLVFRADPATGQILVTQFDLQDYTVTVLMQASRLSQRMRRACGAAVALLPPPLAACSPLAPFLSCTSPRVRAWRMWSLRPYKNRRLIACAATATVCRLGDPRAAVLGLDGELDCQLSSTPLQLPEPAAQGRRHHVAGNHHAARV